MIWEDDSQVKKSGLMTEIEENVRAITNALGEEFPKTALVLGSGLGPFAETLSDITTLSYKRIPHFPQPTVEGHAGRLIIGKAEGARIACLQGRMHLYEGHSPASLAIPVRTLKMLGVENLILTNAAGSLMEDMPPASLMMIEDHINLSGRNPLTGPNDDSFGPRFSDMTVAYDVGLRKTMEMAAGETGVKLFKGVYIQVAGPNFETPAEVRMCRILGANAVGMSTVPEVIVARHCDMKVAGLSVITNFGSGMGHAELTHDHTMSEAEKAYDNTVALLTRFLNLLDA